MGDKEFGQPTAAEVKVFWHLQMGRGDTPNLPGLKVNKDEDPEGFGMRVFMMHSVLKKHYSEHDRQHVYVQGLPPKLRREVESYALKEEEDVLD